MTPLRHIEWLSDLTCLEIVLWERVNTRLRQEHDLSLSFFESLFFIAHSPTNSLRVSDLARTRRMTLGATSKLVSRIESAGLIRRLSSGHDRRTSHLVLTPLGEHKLADASKTYESEVAAVLDSTLSPEEQQYLHNLVSRLLVATAQ